MMEEHPKSIPHEPTGYREPVGSEPTLLLDQYEKEIYVDKMPVEFSGYFSYPELLELINDWCRKHGYYRMLQDHKEKLTKNGRNISLGFQLTKQFTHIHLSAINMDIEISNMTTEYKTIDNVKTRVNKGDIKIIFNGFLMTHLRNRWETKPNIAFLRGVIDKFIYKLNRAKYPGTVVSDANSLAAELRGMLDSWRSKIQGRPKERRIPTAVSEEERKKLEDKEKIAEEKEKKKKQEETKENKEASPDKTEQKSQNKSQSETETKSEKEPENPGSKFYKR